MTPTRRVRGLGSAKSGTSHFIRQRVTGVLNTLFLLLFVIVLARNTGYQHLIYTLSNPVIMVIFLMGACSAIYHMVLGMQVVIEDYVRDGLIRNILLIGNIVIGCGLTLLAATAVLRLGLVA